MGKQESLYNNHFSANWVSQFSANQSIWSLVILSISAKLVPTCVTSDMASLVRG